MAASAPVAVKANGVSTVVNTIASPAEAFEALRVAPTWGWACLIALVLLFAGAYLQGPAARHAGAAQVQQMMNTSSFFANMTPAQKQQAIARAGRPSPWSYAGAAFVLFLTVFLNTIVMLIGNAVGKGQADFKRLWCGSMNIAVPTLGLGAVVLGVIAMMRGADSFGSTFDLMHAMPSLGSLVHGGPVVLAAFLSGVSIFTLWGVFLNATMLRVTARTSTGVAYVFAILVLLLGAALAAAGTQVAHGMGMA